jgi:hypothetical protein
MSDCMIRLGFEFENGYEDFTALSGAVTTSSRCGYVLMEIGADVFEEFLMLVEEIGDGLEFGIELHALPLELQVDETELSLIVAGHTSLQLGEGEKFFCPCPRLFLQYIVSRQSVKSL